MKLGEYLRSTAERYPNKTAAICGDNARTFAELDRNANRIANALSNANVRAGDRVALLMPNGLEVVELMLGIARLGAVMVPISTRLSSHEIQFILRDCKPCIAFVDAEFTDLAHQLCSAVITVDDTESDGTYRSFIAQGPDTPPPPLAIEIEDLVLGYTSGTTGRPKGAIGTHSAMVMASGYINAVEFELTAADRLMITSPMAHRVGLSRVINMVCIGLTIVILPRFGPEEAVAAIELHRVSVVSTVPTIAKRLLGAIAVRPLAKASVKSLLATGESFPVDLKAAWLDALPHLRLYTSYAQTEAGIVASLRPEEQRERPESIGRAVPGVEVRLVDSSLCDVPIGTPGEALVRFGAPGTLLTMKGYFERPEATAETLLANGWLRTGDMLRSDDDGYLYFVDRAKDMIVSGGLNIYAKEVELAIAGHPDVDDVAVLGVPDHDYGEAVFAFVECIEGARVSEQDIIEHCRSRIASYKKPRHVQFVQSMPRTASGKIQKGKLRQTID